MALNHGKKKNFFFKAPKLNTTTNKRKRLDRLREVQRSLEWFSNTLARTLSVGVEETETGALA